MSDLLTPAYLFAHGFTGVCPGDEVTELVGFPFFDPEWSLCFAEKDNRRLFVVTMNKCDNGDLNEHQVYVQEDAGCGFVTLPDDGFGDVTVEQFECMYYGIKREKPKPCTP